MKSLPRMDDAPVPNIVMARPLTTWFPFSVTQMNECTSPRIIPIQNAPATPSHGLPVE